MAGGSSGILEEREFCIRWNNCSSLSDRVGLISENDGSCVTSVELPSLLGASAATKT